jgi:fucose permease
VDDRTLRSPRPGYLLGFVVLGVALSFVGPAMTHLRGQVGATIGQGGIIAAGQSLGYILTSLAVARRYDRGHGHRTYVQAVALIALAIVLVDAVDQLWLLVVCFALVGAGAATIDVGGNTLLVWHEPPERAGTSLNLLHLCFGIGAIATPLLVSVALDATDGLVPVAVVVALAAVVLAVILGRSRQPRPRHEQEHHVPVPAPYRRRVLRLVQAFFFVYVGAEATFAIWVTTWGEDLDLGGDRAPAILTAVFWTGFTLGRLAAVIATRTRANGTVLIAACAASTVAAIALLGSGSSTTVAWIATPVLGFALGPQFATMFAVADGAIGLDGRTTSHIIAASGIGTLAIPTATGWLLDAEGTGLLPAVVLIGAAASTVAALAVVRAHDARPTLAASV